MAVDWLKQRVQVKVGDYWSKRPTPVSEAGEPLKLRWWQSPTVLRNINQRVSGKAVAGMSAGLVEVLKERHGDQLPLARGVSVGGGNGVKEMYLLSADVVQKFDLYELSEARVKQGRKIAEQRGLADRIHFHLADAFEDGIADGQYDIVHWNNSLHHMFDMDQAVGWSARVLRPQGIFYMDDFIGPDRFQWTDEMLEISTRARAALSARLMLNPRNPKKSLSTAVCRPDVHKLAAVDPSEAVQSSKILPAIKQHFPNVDIRYTGGAIYNMTLADILHNFDESDENDAMILQLLLLIDELSSELGRNHYAVALATKT